MNSNIGYADKNILLKFVEIEYICTMKVNLDFLYKIFEENSLNGTSSVECKLAHKFKSFKRGEHIALQGNVVAHLYVLVKGKVKTEIVSDSGLTVAVEELSAPFPLAAALLFADNNRFPVDVTAMEECDIVMITKSVVEQHMAESPEFLRGFLAFIANRVQFLSARLKIFSQKGIKAKIAYYILDRSSCGEFELGRSVASLAEYFGVERPSLSRAFSQLIKDEIIELKSGKGKILKTGKIQELLD